MESAIATKSLWDMLLAGGPLLLPILVSSFVLLLVVFERTLSLRRSRVAPRLFAERFLLQIGEGALSRAEALQRCEQNNSHVANVFAAAVRRWGKPAVEIEQAFLDEGERAASDMRRFLRVINGVATVCPLMGLLGTVWGMMAAFEAIAGSSAMGRPELLAGGIGGALLSTAAGLSVAIPALILYLWFVGRVDMLVMEIDRHGQNSGPSDFSRSTRRTSHPQYKNRQKQESSLRECLIVEDRNDFELNPSDINNPTSRHQTSSSPCL